MGIGYDRHQHSIFQSLPNHGRARLDTTSDMVATGITKWVLLMKRNYNSLDYTFCTGQRCGIRETCFRYIENLKKDWLDHGMKIEGRRLSTASFADHDGKCKMFISLEETP